MSCLVQGNRVKSKVTVMIPTYNQPQYIRQCVKSVLDQDYPNIEILISDDSTTDETEKIVKEEYCHDPRVKYFHNIPKLGRVKNYHKTLHERASGDYVLNLDGDDWLTDESYISKAVSVLNKDDDIVCVIGNQINYFEETDSYTENNANFDLNEVNDGNRIFLDYPYRKISINHLSNVYRRKDAIAIDFYRMDLISSDRESILRLILNRKVGYIPDIAGAWRVHGSNESSPLDVKKKITDLDFIDSVYNYAVNKSVFDQSVLKAWQCDLKKRVLRSYFVPIYRDKNYFQFLKLFYLVGQYDVKLMFIMLLDLPVKLTIGTFNTLVKRREALH